MGSPTVYFSPRKLAAGELLQVRGNGCDPIRNGQISIDSSDDVGSGPRKSVPISSDGSYATLLVVPRTAKAGTYGLRVTCVTSNGMNGIFVDDAVVVTKPKN